MVMRASSPQTPGRNAYCGTGTVVPATPPDLEGAWRSSAGVGQDRGFFLTMLPLTHIFVGQMP